MIYRHKHVKKIAISLSLYKNALSGYWGLNQCSKSHSEDLSLWDPLHLFVNYSRSSKMALIKQTEGCFQKHRKPSHLQAFIKGSEWKSKQKRNIRNGSALLSARAECRLIISLLTKTQVFLLVIRNLSECQASDSWRLNVNTLDQWTYGSGWIEQWWHQVLSSTPEGPSLVRVACHDLPLLPHLLGLSYCGCFVIKTCPPIFVKWHHIHGYSLQNCLWL